MGWIWSNPDPEGPTMAQLQGHVEPRMPDLGPTIAALLRYRQAQQQQQADGINGLLSGIAKGIGGIDRSQQQGAADDAANAAIYGRMYPNDAASAYTDPGRVPDYGGTDALQAMRYAGDFTKQPQAPQLMTLPNGQQYLWSPNSGGVHPLSTGKQINPDDDVLKAAKTIVDNYTKANGLTQDLLSSSTAVHSGKDANGNDVPAGMYRIDIPESAKAEAHTIDVNSDDFQRAHKALDQMNRILESRMGGGLSGGVSSGASTYVPGMGGIEGGPNDATGRPAIAYQVSPTGATFAVKPTDPRFGMQITASNPDGRVVTGTATDFGPGVKNVDIASRNPADAKSSPFDNAVVTPSPQEAFKGLTPGVTRVVNGVQYVWNGDRWNPVK